MSDSALKTVLILVAGSLLLACVLLARPDYLASPLALGAIVAGEVLLAAVCKYRKAFFPVLIMAFLWAGSDLPFHGAWLQGRWFVLTAGALAGLAVYLNDRDHHFSAFHLVAFFCILSAMASASVSAYPSEAVLKALSLALLFIYGAGGARAAVPRIRPEVFFRRLLAGSEVITWLAAVCYWMFHWAVLGNPNSLGAVMGVVVIPLLLWGFLTSQGAPRVRLGVELVLAMLLLMSSYARAGMAGAAVSCFLVCIALRQYRLTIKGIAAVVVLAIAVAWFAPLPSDSPRGDESTPITSLFLYKGKQDDGLWGSREGPWNRTWSVIKDHPWFGSGFGTSVTDGDLTQLALADVHSASKIIREHGNSYLAITEWVGLLGVAPFYFLIVLMGLNVRKVFAWLRRTGDVFSPAVPAAAVVAAGLVHAIFEDWMFAVGYYLCVFFWTLAFILVDVLPEAAVAYSPATVVPIAAPQFRAVASGQ